jgi:hypothetical protein
MGFILKERLKWLKVFIKEWNKETYGDPNENKNELIADILALDNMCDCPKLKWKLGCRSLNNFRAFLNELMPPSSKDYVQSG